MIFFLIFLRAVPSEQEVSQSFLFVQCGGWEVSGDANRSFSFAVSSREKNLSVVSVYYGTTPVVQCLHYEVVHICEPGKGPGD